MAFMQEDKFDLDKYERKVDRNSSDSEDQSKADGSPISGPRAKRTGPIRAIGKRKTTNLWADTLVAKKDQKEEQKPQVTSMPVTSSIIKPASNISNLAQTDTSSSSLRAQAENLTKIQKDISLPSIPEAESRFESSSGIFGIKSTSSM